MDEGNLNRQRTKLETHEVNQILTRAKQGDQSVLPQLREVLDDYPELWQKAGDLGDWAREAIITFASNYDLTAEESMRRKMKMMQQELIGDSTSPVIRLLAEQCVLCWAQLHLAELMPVSKDLQNAPHGYEFQKRINAAQDRYDRALKSLITVQRLLGSKSEKPTLKVVSEEAVAG